MPKYQLDIPHTLAADEAKKRIADATGKLRNRLRRRLHVEERQRAVGLAQGAGRARDRWKPSRVHIDLNLGFLLTPFAERIKAGIAKQLTGILTTT